MPFLPGASRDFSVIGATSLLKPDEFDRRDHASFRSRNRVRARVDSTITVHFPHLAPHALLQVCSIAQIRNHHWNAEDENRVSEA